MLAKPKPKALAFPGFAIKIPGVPGFLVKLVVPYTSTVPLKVKVPLSSFSCPVTIKHLLIIK